MSILGNNLLGNFLLGDGGGGFVPPDDEPEVTSTLSLSQLIVEERSEYGVNSLINFNQTITSTRIYNQSINSLINFNQSYAYTPYAALDHITFTQTIVGARHYTVTSTLTLSQTVSRNTNYARRQSHIINLSDLEEREQVKTEDVFHGFGMNQVVVKQKVVSPSITHALNLSQEIRFTVYNRTVPQTLNLSQTIAYIPIYPRTLSQSIALNQTISLIKTTNLSVTNQLEFANNRLIYVGMSQTTEILVPNLHYTLIHSGHRRCSILQVNNASIVLPSPEFGDNVAYGGLFNLRRSMTGVAYTYVRAIELRKLKLNFVLSTRKALELQQYLNNNNTKIMKFTTWKGDVWYVNLITNPIEYTKMRRYYNEDEAVSVDLEFEGLKVA